MNPPLPPPDDREVRLTALLLGELPAAEADALRQELEHDADLRQLHDRLSRTIGLVRETIAAPDQEPAAGPDAPRLAAERREQLLARFKVVPVRPSRWREWRRQHGREVAALAAMLMALLLIAAVLSSKPESAGITLADYRREGALFDESVESDRAVRVDGYDFSRNGSPQPAATTAAGESPVLARKGFIAQLWSRSDASKSGTEQARMFRLPTGGSPTAPAPTEPLADRPTSAPAPGNMARKYAEGELAQSSRHGVAAGSVLIESQNRRLASIALPASDDAVVTSGGVAWEERSQMATAGDTFWFGNAPASGTTRNVPPADSGVTDLALVTATPSIQPVPPPPPPPAGVPAPTPTFTVADPAANLGFGELDKRSGLAANRPAPVTRALSELTVVEKTLRDESAVGTPNSDPNFATAPVESKAEDFIAERFSRVARVPSQPAPAPVTPQPVPPPSPTPVPPVAGPVAAAELVQAAKLYIESGRHDLADAKLREATKADSGNAGAQYYSGLVEGKKQQVSDGIIKVESAYPANRPSAEPKPAGGEMAEVERQVLAGQVAPVVDAAAFGVTPPINPANPTANQLSYFAKGLKMQGELDDKAASAKPVATAAPVPMDAFITAKQENASGLHESYAYSVTSTNGIFNSFHDLAPFAGGGFGGGGMGGQNWAMQVARAGKDAAPQSAQGRSSFESRMHRRVESLVTAPVDASGRRAIDALQTRNWDTDADGTLALARGEAATPARDELQSVLAKEKAAPAEADRQRRGRVEIALPAGERGEVRESLRLANGPVSAVVVNESMYLTPSDKRSESEFVTLGDAVAAGAAVTAAPARQSGALGVTPAKPAPGRPPLMLGGIVADGEKKAKGTAETELRAGTKSRQELLRKLDSITIDQLASDGLQLNQVLDVLAREAQKADPDKKGVNLVITPNISPEAAAAAVAPATGLPVATPGGEQALGETTVNIQGPPVRGLTLRQALEVVSKTADSPIQFSIEDDGIRVSAADKSKLQAKPIARTFKVDSKKLAQGLEGVVALDLGGEVTSGRGGGGARRAGGGAQQLNTGTNGPMPVAEGVRQYLRAAGVPLPNDVIGKPPAVEVNERTGELTVRGSLSDLDLVEQAVAVLGGTPKPEVPVPPPGAPIPQPEMAAADNLFSTFSLNVSDVSFKLAAASLEKGQMPEAASVRTEEFINAFDYRDPEPGGSAPVAFAWERARYPFAHDRDLLRFSVKTAASGRQPGRPLNLVLAIDNSGSMERSDRVRILRECLRVLGAQLQPQDRVSVVAFARTARLVVDGLPGRQGSELPQRAGDLTPQGGTNLEDAMNLAWQAARRHYLSNGVNRVVLLTDGAANLGDVDPESLKRKVEAHRQEGFALDCFGIGWEGYNDELLEQLSRNGDGRYGFVNSSEAAATEFAGQLAGALKVAASDVKVQVEWNPRRVTAWRQLGYAKHQLKKEQFRDNTVDAAEIGAAEAGNALYTVQVNPAGEGPLGVVRVRFKVPGTSDYREHEWPLPYAGPARALEQSSPALRLAAGAAAFSEWLVSSPFAAEVTPDKLLAQMRGVPEVWGADRRPAKLEWMIRQARSVAGR